jgi:hypothetical protein
VGDTLGLATGVVIAVYAGPGIKRVLDAFLMSLPESFYCDRLSGFAWHISA